jgi:hypothetical protein
MYLVGRFRSKRLDVVEKDRPVILSAAIAALTKHVNENDGDNSSHAARKILIAILSEVETLIADTEGVYVEVNLLVPHPTDDNMMRCIERAKGRRDLPRDYPKKGMIAWRCMEEVKPQHQPNYTPERNQAYHSILCFPLYSTSGSGETIIFGVVSIDHGKPYEFDGIEDELEERILPYLRLLEHMFVLQGPFAHDPPRTSAAKPPKRRR